MEGLKGRDVRLDESDGGSLLQSQLLEGPCSKLHLLDENLASSFFQGIEVHFWEDKNHHRHLEVLTAVRTFQADRSGKSWLGCLLRPWECVLSA